MDEDLLADDGQFKDDGLDELDLDEEAALLGLSDEEIEDKRNLNDDPDVEYFDEEGNPVEIGENNADLYEVANVRKSDSADEDILDLNLDDELDSFMQDDVDSSPIETPKKAYEKQKGNLISLTSRKELEKVHTIKRKESISSPNIEIETTSNTIAYVSKSLTSSQRLVPDSNDEMEFDEESEDEDDHRERFRSERSNIITLTPAKKRTDIPDTLDSVISQEETAKVQAFLENEQKRKMRFKGRPLPRMKSATYSRNPQPFMNKQQNQAPQYSPPEPSVPPVSTQSRKILINPHFRGVLVPPTSGETSMACESTPAPISMPSYDQPPQNLMPPVYSHQDMQSPMNVAPPIYSSPPAMQYNPPDYPPQPPIIQQAPPSHSPVVWQTQPPPDMPPPVSYSAPPPPVMNYASQPPPSYQNNYNSNNFQNPNFQAPPPPVPIPQGVSYNQPPLPFHMQPPTYTSPPVSSVQTSIPHPGYHNTQPSQEPYHQMKMAQSVTPHYQQNIFPPNQHSQPHHQNTLHQNRPLQQNQRPLQQNLRPLQQNQQMRQNQFQRKQSLQQNQRFPRQGEKRPLNSNIKEVPMKIARTDSIPARKNTRMINSNIKEIPLVDTMSSLKPATSQSKAVVEEEDEETKELRMKIEEQKRLREQILKQKEERRRQMAAQRLTELKKRQASQNKNVISLTQTKIEPSNPVRQQPQPVFQQKLSVKERIGVPPTNVTPVAKKKIVVLRKKPVQPAPTVNAAEPKMAVLKTQKTGNENVPMQNKVAANKQLINNVPNQTAPKNVTPTAAPKKKIISLKKVTGTNKQEITPSPSSNTNQQKSVSNPVKPNIKQTRKGPIQSRLGNRPGFQKKEFKNPRGPFQQRSGPPPPLRFQGPRGPQFSTPPFMDQPRMRGPAPGPPMNEMRMPMPPAHSFHEPRPPLLAFRPPGERPHFNQFRFESNRPSFHPQNPGDMNRPRFHPQDMNHPDFHGPQPNEHHQFGPPGHFDHPNQQFHPGHRPQRPGFQNFRPRGMDMFPPDRFPPPHFHNQVNQPRQFFDSNNPMPHRAPFYQDSNRKQRFSRPNAAQQKQMSTQRETKQQPKPVEPPKNEKLPAKSPVADETNANQINPKSGPQPENSSSDTVCVENLSSSTDVGQLRKLCSAVGVVKNINLVKNERKAVIKFKEAQQALSFQKKYQRYMLDLAMIQVSLLP
ncbi:RNA-binding protein 33 isoform X1 [Parasteatoda tepidariorum]|uniref:RNA-binding protein 33 isoform X1 n=2 Tax=Parasteatoda tepidariorum TaxID=114398 RepID=UPI001C71D57C|nr:RNA-binding protein 33 isoform X1 [Parasteatoda tepidariorum]